MLDEWQRRQIFAQSWSSSLGGMEARCGDLFVSMTSKEHGTTFLLLSMNAQRQKCRSDNRSLRVLVLTECGSLTMVLA